MFRASIDGLDEAINELETGVLTAYRDSLSAGAEIIAGIARRDHPYTDRTGDLTASIESIAPPAAGFSAAVVAGEDYASFLEERGFAFLEPAARTADPYMENDLDNRLRTAIGHAAWVVA